MPDELLLDPPELLVLLALLWPPLPLEPEALLFPDEPPEADDPDALPPLALPLAAWFSVLVPSPSSSEGGGKSVVPP
jgi:hypothetical protein